MKKIWCIGILSFLGQSLFTGCVHKDRSESRALRDPTIFYLDHAYTLTQSKEDFESLMTKGFLRNEETAHHPGQLLCQFVNLKTPVERSYYIEICHKDPSLPKDDLSDSKDPRDTAWPGVSLKVNRPLRTFYEDHEAEWKSFSPKFTHKNYAWNKDPKADWPGWNSIEFDNDPMKGLYFWFGEHERDPSRTLEERAKSRVKNLQSLEHPNTARILLGHLWQFSEDASQNFAKIVGVEPQRMRTNLPDGTWIQWVTGSSELGKRFKTKTYPLYAIVIGVESLETFQKFNPQAEMFSLMGRDAVHIRMPDHAYDIIALQTTVRNN